MLSLLCTAPVLSQSIDRDSVLQEVDKMVVELMESGDVPGLSMVIVLKDTQFIKSYGYADPALQVPVSPMTLFELGSCSKAFTSLAALRLVKQGHLHLDSAVSYYLPFLRVRFEGSKTEIKVKHLLHHTSGIPWNTISQIPQSSSPDALQKTIEALVGCELNSKPGTKYEYATINYDVIALIIEKVSGVSFETFVQRNVLIPLGLTSTTVGAPFDQHLMAVGHKVSFFQARSYHAPEFKGNNAAGYIISNGHDMAHWLKFQMGLVPSEMADLIEASHQRDETVPLHNMSSYAMGWEVSLNGTKELYHGGLNPAFTSYVAFRAHEKIGVVVLTNSNSIVTSSIGDRTMKLLAGEDLSETPIPENSLDKTFSVIAIVLGVYLLTLISWFGYIMMEVIKGRRQLSGLKFNKIISMLGWFVILCPFAYAVYIVPVAIAGFSWQALYVWTPFSVVVAISLIGIAMAGTYFLYVIGLFFPESDRLKAAVPRLVLFSVLSGIANMAIIVLITSSIGSTVELKYLLFYYGIALSLYILGRRYVQVNLIKLSRQLTYEIRVRVLDKIFATSYQNFEKVDSGRIHSSLNDDVNILGESSNLFVMLITSIFTTVAAFIYLGSIAFWATVLTVITIVTLTALYSFAVRKTHKYFEEARDTRNTFIDRTTGLINGFKEINLHQQKKAEYRSEILSTASDFKDKITTANVRFATAYVIGELLLVGLLGVVAFGIPELFPNIGLQVVMRFIIVLLYLIGPINAILNSMPTLVQFRVALNRINQFMTEVPSSVNDQEDDTPVIRNSVSSFVARSITFKYSGEDQNQFSIGPIELALRRGEVLFIIGGNGSGKTTLAKLLTGLYKPDEGSLLINDQPASQTKIGEYVSAVFNPPYLFDKIYGVDLTSRSAEITEYLKALELDHKVTITNGVYSTTNLSSGQRKRLALLQCYLEDAPIFLFDEWAVDQDPAYRRFFYRTLLPQMKENGKIVIAITHDDQYFDVADTILKMDQGKLEPYVGELSIRE